MARAQGRRPVGDAARASSSSGPQVGKELYENGALALLLVSHRHRRATSRCASNGASRVAAIIANLHDVIIILGFFALFQWEFSLPVLARGARGARLFGQRVGGHRRPDPRELPQDAQGRRVTHVIDNAITSTISRTIITHGCTLMMVLSILFFGGETLHYFALALDDRHLLRHLLVGAGDGAARDVDGRVARRPRQARASKRDGLEGEKILP